MSNQQSPVPFKPQIFKLSNGMTLINVYVPQTTAVTAQIVVRAGSRDEIPLTAGLAHFEEHMLFTGTDKLPTAGEITQRLTSGAGFANAFTSNEMVSYYGVGPASDLLVIAETLCDMLSHPKNDATQMKREVNAVLEELGKRQQKTFTWAFDALNQVCYAKQSMGWSAIGFEANVKAVTQDQMVAYHDTFYDPTQSALIVCGGAVLDVADAERLVQDYPNGNRGPRTQTTWQGEPFIGKTVPVSKGERQQVDAILAIPGIAYNDPDELALSVLLAALDMGASSRISTLQRRNPQLAMELFAGAQQYSDTGKVYFGFRAEPKNQERAVQALLREMKRLADTPLEKAELDKARTLQSADILQSTQHSDELAMYYAKRYGNNQPLISPQELSQAIDRVTASQVQNLAKRLLTGLPEARLAFIHPADPLTQRNACGQSLQEQGQSILDAARQATTPDLDAKGL